MDYQTSLTSSMAFTGALTRMAMNCLMALSFYRMLLARLGGRA